jgi:D-alanyl-D-alanine carboxypeptidase
MSRILISILFLVSSISYGQFAKKIDSLITAPTSKPFNGVILIAQGPKIVYAKTQGHAQDKIPLKLNDQFVIGSISKQIAAVMVLHEFDKGHLQLHVPIRQYLPELKAKWADSVTIHQLLTHTHGITKLDVPLAFEAGTQYAYSQIGYQLLSDIIERTSGKSFSTLSSELFKKCKMTQTFHPAIKHYKNLVKGNEDGKQISEKESLENYVAAGSFISTASDLLLWNNALHNGHLLKASSYQLMMTKQKNAVRQHPIFGITAYGYGITVSNKDNILQVGQTGFAPGFISMDFYFPAKKVSVILLDNMAWDTDNLMKTFYYHLEILKILKASNLLNS